MTNKRIALVTGATRGIGERIARLLAQRGMVVVCAGRSKADGVIVTQQIAEQGGEAYFISLNLASSESIDAFVREFSIRFDSLDVLVHNAGISGPMGPVETTPVQDVREVMQVNVEGVFLLTRLLIPRLRESSSGRIVMISSIAYRINPAYSAAYNMSKAALNGLSLTLAKELGPDGITVNSVAPGLVLTDRIKNERIPGMAKESGLTRQQMQQQLTKGTLTGKLATEKDIAEAVAFFASPDSQAVTGQILNVSSGM